MSDDGYKELFGHLAGGRKRRRQASLRASAGSAPSPRAIEAAWRIWKGEVTAEHATIQTVAEMATIIANIFEPTEHVCAMSCDFNGQCMVCGIVVPMREPNGGAEGRREPLPPKPGA